MRTPLRLALGLCLFGSLVSPAEARRLADWQFEEGSGVVFLNSVPGGRQPNDGILINQLSYVSVEIDGEERFALLFDGTNDIAVVPDSRTLRPRRAISIEALINPSPGARVIIGKQISIADNTFNSYQLELDPFCFNLTDESGAGIQACGDEEPSPDEWHHVVGTWDGETMELFLDGVLVGSTPFAGPIAYDNNPVLIGGEDDGLGIPGCCLFIGAIDQIKIFDNPFNDDDDD